MGTAVQALRGNFAPYGFFEPNRVYSHGRDGVASIFMTENKVAGLEIETRETEAGVPVVHLCGEIDLHTCPDLRVTLQRLMESGKHHIVLNLAEVPYLDSAALGVLVDAVRRAREHDGGLYLVQVTPFVRRAFEITRLIKIFKVQDTVDSALEAIADIPPPAA